MDDQRNDQQGGRENENEREREGSDNRGRNNNPGNFANDRDKAREAGRKGGKQ